MSSNKGFVPIVLAAIIAGGVLVVGGGTYAGATYYQSNKLIKEADKLVADGNYQEAITKYEKAKKKWRWAKTENKKTETEALNKEKGLAGEGEASFGKGEWQKCLEYLGQVTSKYPKYGEIQTRYSDCQKKLDEQAAVAKAEADRLAAESAAQTVTKKKTTASKSTSSAAPSAAADSYAGWQTYTDPYAKVSFKYPSGWGVEPYVTGFIGPDTEYNYGIYNNSKEYLNPSNHKMSPIAVRHEMPVELDDGNLNLATYLAYAGLQQTPPTISIGGQTGYLLPVDSTSERCVFLYNGYVVSFIDYTPLMKSQDPEGNINAIYEKVLASATFQ